MFKGNHIVGGHSVVQTHVLVHYNFNTKTCWNLLEGHSLVGLF